MDIYTLNRKFLEEDSIDDFQSCIWTERYRGDGDVKLIVPDTNIMKNKLYKGQLLGCNGSDQPMILESREIKNGQMECNGITLAQWVNNRIIRTSPDHKVREWNMPTLAPLFILQRIAAEFVSGSTYLTSSVDIGIPNVQKAIMMWPEVLSRVENDSEWDGVATATETVPFGPVYDVMKAVADKYDLGIKMVIDYASDEYYMLGMVAYYGHNRTSSQTTYPVVQFSKDMDSFTNIRDLDSVTDHRNSIYVFAPGVDPALITGAGHAEDIPVEGPGGYINPLDLRVEMAYADDIDTTGKTAADVLNILNEKAKKEQQARKQVALVDGEIVEVTGAKYGIDFSLGDVVEVQGNSGILAPARVTEYIRSQDTAGERAYPTLSFLDV